MNFLHWMLQTNFFAIEAPDELLAIEAPDELAIEGPDELLPIEGPDELLPIEGRDELLAIEGPGALPALMPANTGPLPSIDIETMRRLPWVDFNVILVNTDKHNREQVASKHAEFRRGFKFYRTRPRNKCF